MIPPRGISPLLRLARACFIVAALVLANAAGAQSPPLRLFAPAADSAADAAPSGAAAARTLAWRSVRPDRGAMDAAMRTYRATAQARVVLDLVDGLALDADVIGVEERPNGATLFLRLVDIELGSAVVTLEGGLVAGHVTFPAGNYAIEPTASGGHRVVRNAPHAIRPDRAPRAVRPPELKSSADASAADPPVDSGRLIDVMVVWTQAAQAALGAPALEVRAQSQIDKANLIYLNSGIAQRVRLVHKQQVPNDGMVAYAERSGSCGAYDECALDDLTGTSDGLLDGVHALRNTHGADLTVLIYKEPVTTFVCGLGWMPQPPRAATAVYGFTVVELGCSDDGFTIPHELGHNMGANHDPYVLYSAPGDGCADGKEKGAYCYSRGFVNVAARWYTVMAYYWECDDAAVFCNPIDYFSNPKLTLVNAPLGTAALNNNAHTLNKTAKAVAAYRATSALHPVAAQFQDVAAAHPFFGYVQFFGQAGISSGCGAGNFCPDAPVTREAMAAFLMRGVKATNWTPPAATGIFTDVPTGSPFASWIEALRNEGITSGCTATEYCPTNTVTRGQMAVFLLRASCGAGYTPGSRPQQFNDVPPPPNGHPFFAFINKLAALGVTSGCGGGNYCPDAPVTRGQMAVFVERSYPYLSPSESCTP